jgi:hypothetical protein
MNRAKERKPVEPQSVLAPTLDDQIAGSLPLEPVPKRPWQESGYSMARYTRTGLLLGIVAGCTSFTLNVIGSALWPAISGQSQHPLQIIQVYLTFPLGSAALQLDSGFLLAFGCVLYLGTSMLYGMLFELSISYFVPQIGLLGRLVWCSILALLVWCVNYYGILIWLQPLLFGGRWIIDLVPWWVAAVTHLLFGWTMALIYPLGTAQAVNPTITM